MNLVVCLVLVTGGICEDATPSVEENLGPAVAVDSSEMLGTEPSMVPSRESAPWPQDLPLVQAGLPDAVEAVEELASPVVGAAEQLLAPANDTIEYVERMFNLQRPDEVIQYETGLLKGPPRHEDPSQAGTSSSGSFGYASTESRTPSVGGERITSTQPATPPEPGVPPEGPTHVPGAVLAPQTDAVTSVEDGRPISVLVVTVAAATLASFAWLLVRTLSPLFARFGPDEAARHPVRQRILADLDGHPWSRQAQVSRRTHLYRTTVAYHLRVLARNGLVKVEQGRRSRYGLAGTVAAPSPPLDSLIVAQLADAPVRLSDLMRRVSDHSSMTRFGAWKRVQRLVQAGVLHTERSGRFVWVRAPAPAKAMPKP